jgi:hypothetical protein
MDDTKIITAYYIIDKVMHSLGHKSHYHAQVTDAEVLTIAVVAAMYFHSNHEKALFVMKGLRYITKPISISRFSRRLHALAQWFEYIVEAVGQLFAQGEAFIIDSMPIPVCHRVRAFRCKKINAHHPCGRHFFSRCAAKKWYFFGWRLHLVCTPGGVPVRFQLLPCAWHDLTPIFELSFGLPKGANVYADKGYVSSSVKRALRPTVARDKRDGVQLVAWHKANMKPNSFEEWCGLHNNRHLIETVNSQLEKMGIQKLHARTNQGFALKVLSCLFALTCINLY